MTRLATRLFGVMIVLTALATALPARADSQGSRDEALAMVDRAEAFLKSHGRDEAIAAFNDKAGAFIDRDLYIVVYNLADGVRLSHPYIKPLIGKSVADAKDIEGKPYGQEILDLARGAGSGWVDYKFSDPTTKKLADKSLYIRRIGDIILGCGIYKH